MRTEVDKTLDSIWLLYALSKARVYGRTKLQKSIFLVELRLQEQGLSGPHFRFFRYTNGPFSRQVWDTLDDLRAKGFVHRTSFEPTERGRFLLELALSDLRAHANTANALSIADDVLEFCRRRSGGALMNHVYKVEVVPSEVAWSGEKMKIENIPMFWDILDPPSDASQLAPSSVELLAQYVSVSDEDVEREKMRLQETESEAIKKLSSALDADQPV